MSEEERFTTAFAAAIVETEAKPGAKNRRRMMEVSTREEHEKQATTLAAFIKSMSRDFINNYDFLSPDLREE